jgi:hypothetical protein
MPCICSDFAARLAADLRASGATVFYGHSDFGSPPGHVEIDTRQLEGLRTFYRRASAENHRIDLCIHCLTRQPLIDSPERFESRLDPRTVFIGTLLAAQYLSTKEGIGTILNLALLDTGDSKNAAMVGAAVDLAFGVTRFAAEVSPEKIRAFAVVPALITPLLGGHSRAISAPIAFATVNWDQERRKLLRVIRQILCDDKWLSCQASEPAILLHSAGIGAERHA